jgi:hypothetical protein
MVGAAAFGLLLCGSSPASAQTTLNFSQVSSDATNPAVLTAAVTFTVVGSQLKVDINNTSAFEIAQLYFNSDVTLTGLAFNAAGATNAAWSIAGTGASQSQAAGKFGSFNWLLDFGSTTRLAAGSTTNLVLDMTGTTTEAGIAGKQSTTPPGDTPSLGALKFESGPQGDSAFGNSNNTTTGPVVPDGPGVLLFASGMMPLLGFMRAVRRKNA